MHDHSFRASYKTRRGGMAFPSPLHPSPFLLEHISEVRILPIRQIQPLLVLEFHVLRVRSQQHFLRVLSLAVPVDEQHVEQAHAPARDDGDLGGDVARRVAGAEGLGADDVADAVWEKRVSEGCSIGTVDGCCVVGRGRTSIR